MGDTSQIRTVIPTIETFEYIGIRKPVFPNHNSSFYYRDLRLYRHLATFGAARTTFTSQQILYPQPLNPKTLHPETLDPPKP